MEAPSTTVTRIRAPLPRIAYSKAEDIQNVTKGDVERCVDSIR